METIDLFMYDKEIEKAKGRAISEHALFDIALRLGADEKAEEHRVAAREGYQHLVYLERTRYKLIEEWANTKLEKVLAPHQREEGKDG